VLVAPSAHEQRLGALSLGKLELGPRIPVIAHELREPPAVPGAFLAARILDDSVEGDVLADHDLSHLGSPCLVVGSREMSRAIRGCRCLPVRRVRRAGFGWGGLPHSCSVGDCLAREYRQGPAYRNLCSWSRMAG